MNATRIYILEQDKILYKNKYFKIKSKKQIDGSNYFYREGTPGVAILPYKMEDNDLFFLVRKEYIPTQETRITLVTGRKDPGEAPLETAIRELKEETGYKAPADKFVDLGGVYMDKDSPNQERFFTVDLTGIEKGKVTTDGTFNEKVAENFWIQEFQLKAFVKNDADGYLGIAYSKFLLNTNMK